MQVFFVSLPLHCVRRVFDTTSSGTINPEDKPSVIATMDLTTSGFDNRIVIFNHLNAAVNRGTVGSFKVSSSGFTFRHAFGKKSVSSKPDALTAS